eukprot:m.319614 g.319614  ORF g.319614 m.319614 type:complete len:51 (-) comp20305_c0_seq16:169-321(-)
MFVRRSVRQYHLHQAAAAAGMGNGEYSASFGNLRAIAVALAPLVYVRAYG